MGFYFDSSAAVKRYAPEIGSGWVNTICESTEDEVYLGQIGVVEIAAALSKKVRTKELTQEDYEAILEVFLEDVCNGEYLIVPLSDQAVELGVDLTRRHPLRGYDAVHLTTAIILNTALVGAGMLPIIFVSADKALCEAARSEGLSADNPNEH